MSLPPAPSRTPLDWTPVEPRRITATKRLQPRDEYLQLPRGTQRRRPAPMNLAPGQFRPSLLLPSSPKPNSEGGEYPSSPKVVDIEGSNPWSRRRPIIQKQTIRRVPSPGATSQYSVAPSDRSFGILDYYLGDGLPSPKDAPPLPVTPRIETPVISQGMDKFDFELTPSKSPSPLSMHPVSSPDKWATENTKSGAERTDEDPLVSCSPRQFKPSPPERKDTYSLFPNVKASTPPRKPSTNEAMETNTVRDSTPKATITIVPSYQQPDASYRPRKESVSSSFQSRKDSFTSFSGTRRIPMRVLQSSTTPTPKTRSSNSNSPSTASPPQQSRWSDDTVTSPHVLTTPGPRTSFGSLLGRDGAGYPACFFEDDDDDDYSCEVAPLRRKLRWQRSSKLRHEVKEGRASRLEGRESVGQRIAKVVLCGCSRSNA